MRQPSITSEVFDVLHSFADKEFTVLDVQQQMSWYTKAQVSAALVSLRYRNVVGAVRKDGRAVVYQVLDLKHPPVFKVRSKGGVVGREYKHSKAAQKRAHEPKSEPEALSRELVQLAEKIEAFRDQIVDEVLVLAERVENLTPEKILDMVPDAEICREYAKRKAAAAKGSKVKKEAK